MDDDAKLQTSSTQRNAIRFLMEQIKRRIERGRVLNLLYVFSKSGLIQFFHRTSKAAPKTDNDDLRLSRIEIDRVTLIQLTRSICHPGIHIVQRLQMSSHVDAAASSGNQTLTLMRYLGHNNDRIFFTVAR